MATNTSSCPRERSTANLAMARRTSRLIFGSTGEASTMLSTTLWRDMSTDRHKSGSLAAWSQERHTRPAPIRISMAPSLTKTDARASSSSSDQSLSSMDAGAGGKAAAAGFLRLPSLGAEGIVLRLPANLAQVWRGRLGCQMLFLLTSPESRRRRRRCAIASLRILARSSKAAFLL